MIPWDKFKSMRQEVEKYDKQREELIVKSRQVLKDSKGAIYSLHRGNKKEAKQKLEQCGKTLKSLQKKAEKESRLRCVGILDEASEEYAEAQCYYWFLEKRTLPSAKEIGVQVDAYLGGVCDLVGELVRKAMNSALEGKEETAADIREFVTELYNELMLFDFRNTPLRRKFDSIKYGLEKLEDLSVRMKYSPQKG